MADPGLEGAVVAETRLSDVDGARGRLVLAGHDVEAIAGKIHFEEACALLFGGDAAGRIGEGRARAFEALCGLGDALARKDGMDALRASLAHLSSEDPALLTGAVAVFAAAWARTSAGLAPIAPDPHRTHASDYARMLGLRDDASSVAALEAYLVTVIDHGMNASTFAARVVASTRSDLASCIVAAIGALKGPLHGGAPGPVLDMLDAIGTPDHAERWLESELAAGRRIMGMGHRVYRVRDPRAAVLEQAIVKLERARGEGAASTRLPLARAVERAAEGALRARHPDRPLHANVEFYTAILLDTLGIPRTAFTPTFAVGRVAGWCAHVAEQRASGRLIRPASKYVGPPVA